jgi:hypothetical protein
MGKRILPRFVEENGKIVSSSPISDAEWIRIKKMLASGEVTKAMVAKRFGVSYGAIWNRLKAEQNRTERQG